MTEQPTKKLHSLCLTSRKKCDMQGVSKVLSYGENELSAICHVCRAICRRAEREIITVNQQYNIDSNIITYVNRLSDFLFVLARIYTKNEEKSDFLWKK